jgi:hypothetical protein
MIFIVVAVIAIGAVGYYLKIYKPKHQAYQADDDEAEEIAPQIADEINDNEEDWE